MNKLFEKAKAGDRYVAKDGTLCSYIKQYSENDIRMIRYNDNAIGYIEIRVNEYGQQYVDGEFGNEFGDIVEKYPVRKPRRKCIFNDLEKNCIFITEDDSIRVFGRMSVDRNLYSCYFVHKDIFGEYSLECEYYDKYGESHNNTLMKYHSNIIRKFDYSKDHTKLSEIDDIVNNIIDNSTNDGIRITAKIIHARIKDYE